MPTNTANGGTVPVGSDPYALTADLKKSIESVRSIIPISSAAAQTNLPTLFGGTLPVPTYIERTDLPGRPIYTWDGAAWLQPGHGLGIIAQKKNTVNSGEIAGNTVIQNIKDLSFKAGRNYKVMWEFEYSGTTAGNYADFSIHTAVNTDADTATTGLTKRGGASLKINDANTGHGGRASATFSLAADAVLQVKFTAFIWIGSGTLKVAASVNNPVVYTVTDEGRYS